LALAEVRETIEVHDKFTHDELQGGFRVGGCLIQPRQNRIVHDGTEVRVEPRVMDVLVCLAARAGEVVSRDTLNHEVWGRVVVTDQAVTNCISELRHHLGDKRSTDRIIETIPKRGYRLAVPVEPAEREPADRAPADRAPAVWPANVSRRWSVAVATVCAVLGFALLAVVWSWVTRPEPVLASVAVMPFENAADDSSLDFLALALPDEVALLLTRSPDLAVRPSGYLGAQDPLAEARERRVGHVISGRYYREDGDRLTVAIEAQQVSEQRVVWRARVTAPAGDLLAMRDAISERVREGLLPVLGAAADPRAGAPAAYDEAYRLYLYSLAVPSQPEPAERAIELLQQAVTLDPGFAQAWVALAMRYYEHGSYGPGGERAREQSIEADRKALALDPDLITASLQLVAYLTEAGDLEAGYREARRLVEQFPASAQAHAALAYVLRFGGLLETSQGHCEVALDRDPHDPRLRSCAYAYLYDGKLSRVMAFLDLDEGSYFAQWGTVLYQLRLNGERAALDVVRQAAPDPTRGLMEPCLQGTRGPALDAAAAQFTRYWQEHSDPETAYAVAPMLYHCGYPEAALDLLERSADGEFCAYPALDRDPVWAGLREDPRFRHVRDEAIACSERFGRIVAAYPELAVGRAP
jgi:DNA-binding winged helix-turn-helix (wHTH) protein/TolB-like protein